MAQQARTCAPGYRAEPQRAGCQQLTLPAGRYWGGSSSGTIGSAVGSFSSSSGEM